MADDKVDDVEEYDDTGVVVQAQESKGLKRAKALQRSIIAARERLKGRRGALQARYTTLQEKALAFKEEWSPYMRRKRGRSGTVFQTVRPKPARVLKVKYAAYKGGSAFIKGEQQMIKQEARSIQQAEGEIKSMEAGLGTIAKATKKQEATGIIQPEAAGLTVTQQMSVAEPLMTTTVDVAGDTTTTTTTTTEVIKPPPGGIMTARPKKELTMGEFRRIEAEQEQYTKSELAQHHRDVTYDVSEKILSNIPDYTGTKLTRFIARGGHVLPEAARYVISFPETVLKEDPILNPKKTGFVLPGTPDIETLKAPTGEYGGMITATTTPKIYTDTSSFKAPLGEYGGRITETTTPSMIGQSAFVAPLGEYGGKISTMPVYQDQEYTPREKTQIEKDWAKIMGKGYEFGAYLQDPLTDPTKFAAEVAWMIFPFLGPKSTLRRVSSFTDEGLYLKQTVTPSKFDEFAQRFDDPSVQNIRQKKDFSLVGKSEVLAYDDPRFGTHTKTGPKWETPDVLLDIEAIPGKPTSSKKEIGQLIISEPKGQTTITGGKVIPDKPVKKPKRFIEEAPIEPGQTRIPGKGPGIREVIIEEGAITKGIEKEYGLKHISDISEKKLLKDQTFTVEVPGTSKLGDRWVKGKEIKDTRMEGVRVVSAIDVDPYVLKSRGITQEKLVTYKSTPSSKMPKMKSFEIEKYSGDIKVEFGPFEAVTTPVIKKWPKYEKPVKLTLTEKAAAKVFQQMGGDIFAVTPDLITTPKAVSVGGPKLGLFKPTTKAKIKPVSELGLKITPISKAGLLTIQISQLDLRSRGRLKSLYKMNLKDATEKKLRLESKTTTRTVIIPKLKLTTKQTHETMLIKPKLTTTTTKKTLKVTRKTPRRPTRRKRKPFIPKGLILPRKLKTPIKIKPFTPATPAKRPYEYSPSIIGVTLPAVKFKPKKIFTGGEIRRRRL